MSTGTTVTASNTLTVSSRNDPASKLTGGSMAVMQTSCSKWFWIMSRTTPMRSYKLARFPMPTSSAAVI